MQQQYKDFTPSVNFYDLFARSHNEGWGLWESGDRFSELEQLLLPHLSEKAHILDLGCGTGQLVQLLLNKGYKVTGLDGSEEVLRYAYKNASNAEFINDDLRTFELPSIFDAVVSIGTLNYFLNLEELKSIFQKVYAALREDGLFAFHLRLAKGYETHNWDGRMIGDIKDDFAWALQRKYILEERIGRVKITIFQLQGKEWQRFNDTWFLKGYFITEVKPILESVGFAEISVYDLQRIPELAGEDSHVVYFVCRKPPETTAYL